MRTAGLAGVPWMLAAMLCFASHDAIAKSLLETYPLAQLVLIGSATGLLAISPRLHRRGWRRTFVVPRPELHLLRAATIAADIALFYASVRLMPLAQCLTIYQAMPLIAAVMSIFVLRERLSPRLWLAILLGFFGVMLVIHPTGEGIAWPAVLALFGTTVYAVCNVLTRLLRGAGDLTLIGWQNATTVVCSAIAVPFFWQPMEWSDVAQAAALGLLTAAGALMLNRSIILSPASLILPFHYSIILWGMALGWLRWRDIPDGWMLAGAAVVVASGIIIARLAPREA